MINSLTISFKTSTERKRGFAKCLFSGEREKKNIQRTIKYKSCMNLWAQREMATTAVSVFG